MKYIPGVKARLFAWLIITSLSSAAQQVPESFPDSVFIRVLPKYDSVSTPHRYFFGENYRKEYAGQTKMPVLRLSRIYGGLVATEKGGGNQSRSLHLRDASGKEYILRSVEKYPEILLPESLRGTFAGEVLKDNMSAQHPFSALVVPVLSDKLGLYHASPVIGYVIADSGLGSFSQGFINTVCLLEERYPSGKSDNTQKMLRRLSEDSEIRVDAIAYLKQKCLDVIIGDWDRHDDQWRWILENKNGAATYQPVPRDRDQVFYRSDGFIQRSAQSSWLLPMMQGYEREVRNINWFLWEGRETNSRVFDELSEAEWDMTVKDVCRALGDETFERALSKLPEPAYSLHHDQLLSRLKERRSNLPEMMRVYYRFFNRIVDIPLSDKSEFVRIDSTANQGLSVQVLKKGKGTPSRKIYSRNFHSSITQEMRIYLRAGADSVYLNNPYSKIRVKIISGAGKKGYNIQNGRHARLFDKSNIEPFEKNGLSVHLSDDTSNTAYIAKDLYRRHLIFPIIGYNNDDGLAVGLGLKFTNPGFRKIPYGNSQSLNFHYSFATSAFQLGYSGEWLKTVGNADLIIKAQAKAPSNTQNFFGLGNQTAFQRENELSYYRARFNIYRLDPALRWRGRTVALTVGPSLEHYTYETEDNVGRLISQGSLLHTADSASIEKNKTFLGATARFTLDSRNSRLMASKGVNLEIQASLFAGLSNYANDYGTATASLAYFKKIDPKGNFVLAGRLGGGTTFGKPTFYQAQFLGGQDNLLGFRQYRFAGNQSIYTNLELRIKVADFLSYVLPGELGLIGLYDSGRVWANAEQSNAWHHGLGGGVFFAPAGFGVLRLMAVRSREGWYPYLALALRY